VVLDVVCGFGLRMWVYILKLVACYVVGCGTWLFLGFRVLLCVCVGCCLRSLWLGCCESVVLFV